MSDQKPRDELAELEADYYSNIQYPVNWVSTGSGDLKQDVNAGRRKACFDHHKWGFQKGYNAARASLQSRLDIAVEALKTISANFGDRYTAQEALEKLGVKHD